MSSNQCAKCSSLTTLTVSEAQRVLSYGAFIAPHLMAPNRGSVLAVFSSSVYLEDESGALLCLLAPGAEPGPLHVLVSRLPYAEHGMPWDVCGHRLSVGGTVYSLRSAKHWCPQTTPLTGAPVDARVLLEGAPDITAAHAYLHAVEHGRSADWRGRALPVLRQLMTSLQLGEPLPPLTSVIGLGPGLTPAADDVLGAMVIVLHGLQQRAQAAAVAERVRPLLAATHPISAAHVRAACHGLGNAALHDFVNAVLSGADDWVATRNRLTALGAQSGWEMVLGATLALEVAGALLPSASP